MVTSYFKAVNCLLETYATVEVIIEAYVKNMRFTKALNKSIMELA